MIKTLFLTEDHLKLIRCIKFEGFDFGGRFNTSDIQDAIDELSSQDTISPKDAELIRKLEKAKDKMDYLSGRAGRHGWGVDQYNLFGGTFVLEDVARIIGRYDRYVEGSKEDPMGADFQDEDKDYMWGLYKYIWDNMEYIFDLLLFFSSDGGITSGTYILNKDGGWVRRGE